MDTFLALWWVFPAAIGFSTVAVGAGVSGALFFSPFFMLVVGLSPAQAIGAGLLTEVFDMGNGLRAYVRQRVVDYATMRWLLVGAIPAVIAGALLAHRVPAGSLKIVFGAGLLVLAGFLLFVPSPGECEPGAKADPEEEGERTVIVGAGIHAFAAQPAWSVVGWSIPGVLIGSTLGSRAGRFLPADLMETILGGVFAAVGALVLGLEIFGA